MLQREKKLHKTSFEMQKSASDYPPDADTVSQIPEKLMVNYSYDAQ